MVIVFVTRERQTRTLSNMDSKRKQSAKIHMQPMTQDCPCHRLISSQPKQVTWPRPKPRKVVGWFINGRKQNLYRRLPRSTKAIVYLQQTGVSPQTVTASWALKGAVGLNPQGGQ